MNNVNMSSTTESSDWEHTIVPHSRRPSTNSQSSSYPRKKSRPTPQPILPRTSGPGQSVFPVSTPVQYVSPHPVNPIYFQYNPVNSASFHQPQYQYVNQSPLVAPSFNTPVNPALTRVINENEPCQSASTTPPTWNPPQDPATPQMDTPPQYITPPSRAIRGVKTGARRARGAARGGRKPRIKAEPSEVSNTPTIVSTPAEGRESGRGRARGARTNRGGRPRGSRVGASASRGVKRKREEDEEKDDSDVSEIITPLPTQSRSGRKITHANNFSPVIIDLEEKAKPSAPAKPARTVIDITETAEPRNGKGKKRASKPGEASVCKNCGRGHSPASNMIVFCDGCNGPWHQFCHDPPISQDVIRIEEQEWLCSDCQVLREEKAHVEGKVSAEALGIVDVSLHSPSQFPPGQQLNEIMSRNGATCKACLLRTWYLFFSMLLSFIRICQSLLHLLVGLCPRDRNGQSLSLWIRQRLLMRMRKKTTSTPNLNYYPIRKPATECDFLPKARI